MNKLIYSRIVFTFYITCIWRFQIRTKETKSTPSPLSRLRSLTLELDQTRQTLTRTLQLNTILSNRIKSLTQELEHGRKEIQHLSRTRSSRLDNPEIEELKFVEQHQTTTSKDVEEEVVTTEELEKRRLVTFASSPLLTRVMSSVRDEEEMKKKKDFERECSIKKTKLKKGFAPFMGWFRANRGGDWFIYVQNNACHIDFIILHRYII